MYDQLSKDYDRFVNWENRLPFEIPFIIQLLDAIPSRSARPKRILDTACGTGMHSLTLAKSGFEVVGCDLNPEMIQKARVNGRNAGYSLRFEEIGFGSLVEALNEDEFDAVLCLGNSLPHLLSQQELGQALLDFKGCLRSEGLLLVQNRNFDAVMEQKERWMEPQTHHDNHNEWLFQRFYDFLPGGLIQFNIVTLKRTAHSKWKTSLSSTLLRPQLHQDLEESLVSSGFIRLQSYGSLKGEPFDPQKSSNLIVTAFKP
ncbi:MAG: class I SAM-dependent methyltransferase [Chloroflexi bacterium]|nr:class I SAM-dependent methyltransferase [Chloroflexota bacterium]